MGKSSPKMSDVSDEKERDDDLSRQTEMEQKEETCTQTLRGIGNLGSSAIIEDASSVERLLQDSKTDTDSSKVCSYCKAETISAFFCQHKDKDGVFCIHLSCFLSLLGKSNLCPICSEKVICSWVSSDECETCCPVCDCEVSLKKEAMRSIIVCEKMDCYKHLNPFLDCLGTEKSCLTCGRSVIVSLRDIPLWLQNIPEPPKMCLKCKLEIPSHMAPARTVCENEGAFYHLDCLRCCEACLVCGAKIAVSWFGST